MNPSTDPQTPQVAPLQAARLEEAFARQQDELLGMLCCLLGNLDNARDALQDAFLKCWRRLDHLDRIENLRAWVFQIALNAGRDLRSTAWRRRSRPLEDKQTMAANAPTESEAEAGRRRQLATLRTALAQLRPEEQEVFLLRQNGELTYPQIARAVGIPLGTVKTRMRLAITKLREAVENLAGGEGGG